MVSLRNMSYEVLPALSVRRGQLRQSLRTVTVAWMYGVVWLAAVSGEQMRAFCNLIGFGDFAFGVLGAVPFIATFGQIMAVTAIERSGLRKYHFMLTAGLHRLLYLAIAATAFLAFSPRIAVPTMLAIMLLSHFLGAMSVPGWTTWMGDLIPRRIRGRYFAKRVQLAQAVQIVVVIAIGILLDWATVEGAPETFYAQPRLLWTIACIFVVSALCGTIDILLFGRVREVLPTSPSAKAPQASWWRMLADPLKDRVFRNYVGFGAVITFTMTVANWYYWRYATEWLGFSKLGSSVLFMVIGPLSGLITAPWWGKAQDRWGRKPVLIMATIGTMISALPWFLTSRMLPDVTFVSQTANGLSMMVGGWFGHADWQIVPVGAPVAAYLLGSLGCIIGGSTWTAVNLAQTGIMLGFSDGPGRNKFVAASAVLISIGGIAGGLVGGAVTEALGFLQRSPIILGCFAWNNWHAAFAISLLGRIPALMLLRNMPDPGSRPVKDLLRMWSSNAYNALWPRVFFPLRVLGLRSRAQSKSRNS